jgi:hypothetical protein
MRIHRPEKSPDHFENANITPAVPARNTAHHSTTFLYQGRPRSLKTFSLRQLMVVWSDTFSAGGRAVAPSTVWRSGGVGRRINDVLQLAAPDRCDGVAGLELDREPWAIWLAVDIADSPWKGRLGRIGLDLLAAGK